MEAITLLWFANDELDLWSKRFSGLRLMNFTSSSMFGKSFRTKQTPDRSTDYLFWALQYRSDIHTWKTVIVTCTTIERDLFCSAPIIPQLMYM